MAHIKYGKLREVFGMVEPKPLRGFPPGEVRLRLRYDCFARAFVRNESGIRHFYVEEVDGFWQPCFEQGANIRAKSKPAPVIPQPKPFTVKP